MVRVLLMIQRGVKLNVPHDGSIEGEFSENNLATTEGGALPSGIGWYRKSVDVTVNVRHFGGNVWW